MGQLGQINIFKRSGIQMQGNLQCVCFEQETEKENVTAEKTSFLPTSLLLCIPSPMAWNHPPPSYTHPDPQNVVIAEVRSSQNIIS